MPFISLYPPAQNLANTRLSKHTDMVVKWLPESRPNAFLEKYPGAWGVLGSGTLAQYVYGNESDPLYCKKKINRSAFQTLPGPLGSASFHRRVQSFDVTGWWCGLLMLSQIHCHPGIHAAHRPRARCACVALDDVISFRGNIYSDVFTRSALKLFFFIFISYTDPFPRICNTLMGGNSYVDTCFKTDKLAIYPLK